MSRLTLCFSMYSDMSICTRAFSSPNMYLASCLASNVLPTPVGPAKMKLPMGRFGSFRPARLLRTALAMAMIGSCWLTTCLCSSSSLLGRARLLIAPQPLQRHAGHLADDLGDHLFIDDAVDLLGLLAPFLGD